MNKILNQNLYKLKNLALFLLINKNLSMMRQTISKTDQEMFNDVKQSLPFLRFRINENTEPTSINITIPPEEPRAPQIITPEIRRNQILRSLTNAQVRNAELNHENLEIYTQHLNNLWKLAIIDKVKDTLYILILKNNNNNNSFNINNNIFWTLRLFRYENSLVITINQLEYNLMIKTPDIVHLKQSSHSQLLFDAAIAIMRIGNINNNIVIRNETDLNKIWFYTNWTSQNNFFQNQFIIFRANKIKYTFRIIVPILISIVSSILLLTNIFIEQKTITIILECIGVISPIIARYKI